MDYLDGPCQVPRDPRCEIVFKSPQLRAQAGVYPPRTAHWGCLQRRRRAALRAAPRSRCVLRSHHGITARPPPLLVRRRA